MWTNSQGTSAIFAAMAMFFNQPNSWRFDKLRPFGWASGPNAMINDADGGDGGGGGGR